MTASPKHPWPLVKLGAVLAPVERAEKVNPAATYRLLGVRLDGNGAFLRETVTGAQTSAPTLYRVETDDFIFSRLFACRGAFGIIGPDLDGCHVSGEFPTFRPKLSTEGTPKMDVRYLRYWFRLPGVVATVNEQCTGSTPLTRNRFKEDKFLALEIPLPPLAEQRRLVARLDDLAGRIAEARKLRAEMAADFAAFVVSYHLRHSAQRSKKLNELLALHEVETTVRFDAEYPQVGVRSFGAGLFSKSAVAGTGTTYKTFNRLFGGAVVLSQVKGWEGAVAVCPDELEGWYVSPEYRTFRCNPDEALPGYLSELIKTEWFWSRLGSATRGAGDRRERTRPEQFLEIEIPMPELIAQRKGAAIFERIRAAKDIQADSAELDALLPALLDRAFKGEL